jgi:hypothetical protein
MNESEHPLIVFPKTENEYNAWIAAHRDDGHVVNAWKRSRQVAEHLRGLIWHRADCGNIEPFGALKYVEGDTMKACSTNPGALAMWAMERGEPLRFCKNCRDKWLKEQRQ